MSFMEAVRACLRAYATLRGRARRSEFWWFQLYGLLLSIPSSIAFVVLYVAAFAGSVSGPAEDPAINPDAVHWGAFTGALAVAALYLFAFTLPSLAVQARRLHDVGQPAWWLALHAVGLGIVVMALCLLEGQHGSNRHGADPRLLPVRAVFLP